MRPPGNQFDTKRIDNRDGLQRALRILRRPWSSRQVSFWEQWRFAAPRVGSRGLDPKNVGGGAE